MGMVSDRLRLAPRQRPALHLAPRAAFPPVSAAASERRAKQALWTSLKRTALTRELVLHKADRTVLNPQHEASLPVEAQAGCALPVPPHRLGHASRSRLHGDKGHQQPCHRQNQKRSRGTQRSADTEGSREQQLVLARDSRCKHTMAPRVRLPGDSGRAKADLPLKSNLKQAFGFRSFRVVV